MATNASNDIIEYYLSVPNQYKANLGTIRTWKNLQFGTEAELIWIKGFDQEQIASKEIKTLPSKKLYYAKNGKLFPLNSLLPDGTIPAILWTPIARGLPITLPQLNHNYFGLQDKIKIKLITSDLEQESLALKVDLNLLEKYIENAPNIRLKHLNWVVIANKEALVIGAPLLPITGQAYWKNQDFFIPLGLNLDYSLIVNELNQIINPKQKHFVLWDKTSKYSLIKKESFVPLTIGSFRKTMNKIA